MSLEIDIEESHAKDAKKSSGKRISIEEKLITVNNKNDV